MPSQGNHCPASPAPRAALGVCRKEPLEKPKWAALTLGEQETADAKGIFRLLTSGISFPVPSTDLSLGDTIEIHRVGS